MLTRLKRLLGLEEPKVSPPSAAAARPTDPMAAVGLHLPGDAAANLQLLRTLASVQDEVARLAPTPWYAGPRSGTYADGTRYDFPAYRSAEAFYWLHLPRWIAEDARGRRIARCLDVGSGYGTLSLFTQHVTGCESYLVDFIGEYMGRPMQEEYGLHFQVCNVELEPIPFPGQFDLVLFSEVMEHLNFHPVPTLRKLGEQLAPGGRLYLSTPDAAAHGRLTAYHSDYRAMPQPQRGRDPIDAHIYLFDERELREVAAEAGLSVERLAHAPGAEGLRHLNAVLVRA